MKHLRRTLSLLICLALVLSLCACGSNSQAPENMQSTLPGSGPVSAGEVEETGGEQVSLPPQASEALKAAQALIGKDLKELVAAFGEPDSSDYAPSCLGTGEDGELHYPEFTVYTYKVNGTETIQDVRG